MTDPATIAKGLPRQARGRLTRHQCWMCEMRLDHGYCGAVGPRCTDDVMIGRMAACLGASRLPEVRAIAAHLRNTETGGETLAATPRP